MTIRIKKQRDSNTLLNLVQEKSGVNLSLCYQCKKCSIGCPVSGQVESAPAEIIRRLQMGADNELLQSDLIWVCLSCDTCYVRCPNEINFAAVIDSLRSIALEKGIAKPAGSMPLFNSLFLNTVKTFGRAYDLEMIALYKLRTGNLKQDMDKFPTMLKKGKMALKPPMGVDKDKVKRIFKYVSRNKGNK